jgi:hypothetical protein
VPIADKRKRLLVAEMKLPREAAEFRIDITTFYIRLYIQTLGLWYYTGIVCCLSMVIFSKNIRIWQGLG